MTTTTIELPSFESYGNYSSDNYGAHTLVFTDHANRSFYYSYRTLVAVMVPGKGKIVRENVWGPTTGKHLNWIDGGGCAKANRVSEEEFTATVAEWLSGEEEKDTQEIPDGDFIIADQNNETWLIKQGGFSRPMPSLLAAWERIYSEVGDDANRPNVWGLNSDREIRGPLDY